MKYCTVCGTKLEEKYLEHEGWIPYCPTCQAYRFKMFNTACSMIVVSKDFKRTVLIQQYQKKKNILTAGYVNLGESLEETVVREVKEELGISVLKCIYNASEYYEKSNTLMVNFIAVVEEETIHPNYEVDAFSWFSLEEALAAIAENSLAQKFYSIFYEKVKRNEI